MSSIHSYGFLFGTSQNTNNASSFFANSNSLLSDYSMIKSGAYKKLLTAYYKQESVSEKDSSESSKAEAAANSEEKAKLLSTKSDAGDLKEAADALNTSSLYRSTKKDEEGNAVYDRDKIKEAVKDYVSAYNRFLDSSSEVDSTTILNKTLSIVKTTATNKNLLKDVGITIGSDNKLVLDEEKLNKASVSTLSSLFTGRGSYSDTVAQKASESYRLANSAAYMGTNASSYTYNGNYSVMGNTNNMLDELL